MTDPTRIHIAKPPRIPETTRVLIDAAYGDDGRTIFENYANIRVDGGGEVDELKLQQELGDAIWVGEGSAWALPWRQNEDDPTDDNLILLNAIHRGDHSYPALEVIREVLAGHDLADEIPLETASIADLLLAIANGRDYQP